jgi:ArsR family transcriptional regulator, lead/cadmium/zinc/bismuth-responsive transcriptional repressor
MRNTAKTHQGACQASILSKKKIASLKKEISSIKDFEKRNQYFKVLSDPTRHKMVILLNEHGPLCVCDLGNILNISPSAVSQHLRRLKDLDLVSNERQGQTIFYSLKNAPCCPLTKLL